MQNRLEAAAIPFFPRGRPAAVTLRRATGRAGRPTTSRLKTFCDSAPACGTTVRQPCERQRMTGDNQPHSRCVRACASPPGNGQPGAGTAVYGAGWVTAMTAFTAWRQPIDKSARYVLRHIIWSCGEAGL